MLIEIDSSNVSSALVMIKIYLSDLSCLVLIEIDPSNVSSALVMIKIYSSNVSSVLMWFDLVCLLVLCEI